MPRIKGSNVLESKSNVGVVSFSKLDLKGMERGEAFQNIYLLEIESMMNQNCNKIELKHLFLF
jgi:hypothetical protein